MLNRSRRSNHGTFCFNQLSALQVMVGDANGAKNSLSTFFKGAYMKQIDANGDQVWNTLTVVKKRSLNLFPVASRIRAYTSFPLPCL